METIALIALIAVGLLSIWVFVLYRSLQEMFRDVRQLRDAAGILDRPLTLDIEPLVGHAPSEYGLPEAMDKEASGLLLFLTERCYTCRVLASELSSNLPKGVWVVAETRTPETAKKFIESTEIIKDERVLMDPGGVIAGRMRLNTAPVGFRIENGRFVSATTVPSVRYFGSILPKPLGLLPEEQAQKQA